MNLDLKHVYSAKSAVRKIISDIDEIDEYREENGLVDGVVEVDVLKRTAKRAYNCLKRFLSELGERDEDTVE